MNRSLGIQIDPHQGEPLYQQIFDQVVSRIRTGALPAGTRLPPTRALAGELSTHRNTVVRAFEELTSAGWLEAVVGRGTFVRDQREAPLAKAGAGAEAGLPGSARRSRAAPAEPRGRGGRLGRALPRPGSGHVDLQSMQPPPQLLPADAFRRCMNHARRSAGTRAMGYAPPEGVPRLREQIAAERSRGGVPTRAEDVLVTGGSQQALDLVFRALLNPGDAMLVEHTTYAGALTLLAAAGAQAAPVPCDDEGPELLALTRLGAGARGLYVMPDGHNPTGRWISRERRAALVRWSRKYGVPLIEDDYSADLDLDGAVMPPALRALDGDVIYVGTYSKKLIPALRLGFVLCPEAARPRLVALKYAMALGSSSALQYALAEFLERGYLRTHLERTLPIYRARRDALLEALRDHLPPEITVQVPRRGLALWVPLPAALDPVEVFHECHRRGVLVSPGALNTPDPGEPSGLRVTFCGEPPERLVEGARRVGEAVRAVAARAPAASTRIALGGP